MSSWHKYGGIGHDSKFKNLMSNNLASNEIAKMNKLYANDICVANDVDVSGNVYVDGTVDISGNLDLCGNAVIDGTLDVSGHSQLCDVSACNVDISGNLRVDASVNFTTGVIDVPRYVNTVPAGIFANFGNVFIGHDSGINSTAATFSAVAVGNASLASAQAGTGNTAIGNTALTFLTSGAVNSAFGGGALEQLISGNNNLACGVAAGRNISTDICLNDCSNCVFLGAETKASADGINNETVIGYDAKGKGSNTVQIGNCDVSDVYLGCDGSGTTLHVDNILLCDLSACNVDISQNLTVDGSVNFTNARKIFMQQGNIILDEQGEIGIGKDVFTLPRNGAYNNIGIGQEALKECTGNNCIDNVAVGSSALKFATGNTSQNVVVGFNAGHEISGNSSDNVLIGRDCGAHEFDSSFIDMSGCVGIGMRAIWDVSGNFNCISIGSQKNVDNTLTYGSRNEIVIGCDASGMGTNTVQIGNCDTSAVYLGCQGGTTDTTLFVDNADISGSLRIEGIDIFENLPVQYMNKVGTLGGTVTITSAEVAEFSIINLKCQSGDGIYTFSLEDVDSADNPTIEGKTTTFGTDFPIVVSSSSCVIHIDLNINDGLTTRTPGRVTWTNKSIGGTHLTWDGNAWSILDCFNQSSILTTAGTPGGGNPLFP